MTTPTYALRLICDEELRTAVRSGARRLQATDVTRSLCFEQFFPTPPATRASCEIYNDCSALQAYVHTILEPSRCVACYSCNVWVSPLGYGIVYVSVGSIELPNRKYFSRFHLFLSPRWRQQLFRNVGHIYQTVPRTAVRRRSLSGEVRV